MAEEIEIGLSIAPISQELNNALNNEAMKAAAQMGSGPSMGVGAAPGAGGAEGGGGEDGAAAALEGLQVQSEAILQIQQDTIAQLVANAQAGTEMLMQIEAGRAAGEIGAVQGVAAAKDKSAKDDEAREKKKEKINKAAVQAHLDGAAAVVGSLSEFAEASGASAKLMKKLALAEIVINTARGVMSATSMGPWGIAQGVIIGAIGAVQFAKAAAEAFEQGGFPSGNNTLIRVNERGQEAVLNSQAVNMLGHGRINAFNNGITNQRTITNEISFSPTINIGSDAPSNLLGVLRQNKEEFARFFEEDVMKRGYLG